MFTYVVFCSLELLKSKGHRVELAEIHDRNMVELWVKGELVYKCKITDLEFGKFGMSSSRNTLSFLDVRVLNI